MPVVPLPHNTPIFSIDAAKIYPMLTDPVGGPATYSAGFKLPGAQSMTWEPDTLSKELFGDNAIIALAGKMRAVVSKVACAKSDLDVLSTLFGGTVTDVGVTPAQTATYSVKNTDFGKYFKLEAQILGVEVPTSSGGGDVHQVCWKCKIVDASESVTAENFAPTTFTIKAIQLTANGKIYDRVFNETAVALA